MNIRQTLGSWRTPDLRSARPGQRRRSQLGFGAALLPFVLFAACIACRGRSSEPAPKVDRAARVAERIGSVANAPRAITLLLTHPSPKVLRNLRFLVDDKVLALPGLRVVALFHERALDHWSAASRYLERTGTTWITLRKIRCNLPKEKVFVENDCTGSFRQLVSTSHGVIFTGGPDLPPTLYGQATRLTTRVAPPGRHLFEASFLYHLIGATGPSGEPAAKITGQLATRRRGRPHPRGPTAALLADFPDYAVLAICLGMETLNVAAGGSLIQDIPSQLYDVHTAQEALALPRESQHACYDRLARSSLPRKDWKAHPVRLADAWSFTAVDRGDRRVEVISAHHQAVGELGKDLIALAHSTDGKIVEALGHKRFPGVLGVQFHPEYSKAFVAQRQCLSAADIDRKPSYRLNERMIAFYRRFWRNFAQKLSTQQTPPPRARAGSL